MNVQGRTIMGLGLSALVVGAIYLLGTELRTPRVFADTAARIVAACSEAPFRPTCYDEEIPKLMDDGFTMEEAFGVTRTVQDMDPEYRYCHVLGHKLSAKETAKDPEKWKDVVARSPSGICSNGAIHGAFQERFRTEALPDASIEELKPELIDVCEPRGSWHPTSLEQASCVHAVGHLTMYITGADIRKSLALCDEIAILRNGWDLSQLCYDGAFMQIFQPLEPDDFALIEGKEQTAASAPQFCAAFSGKEEGSCVSESAALYREEIRKDPPKLLAHCSVLLGVERDRCESALTFFFIAQLGLDMEASVRFCAALPPSHAGRCFGNAASRFIEVDWRNMEQAVSLCAEATRAGVGDACWSELARMSGYTLGYGSEQSRRLCSMLPDAFAVECAGQARL